jgi:hypothetical protein
MTGCLERDGVGSLNLRRTLRTNRGEASAAGAKWSSALAGEEFGTANGGASRVALILTPLFSGLSGIHAAFLGKSREARPWHHYSGTDSFELKEILHWCRRDEETWIRLPTGIERMQIPPNQRAFETYSPRHNCLKSGEARH